MQNSGDTQLARKYNREGEAVYKTGQLEQAIQLFQQATELDGNYGQAFSNLGLAYQKNGNIAEAIWANRKAISLASGANRRQRAITLLKFMKSQVRTPMPCSIINCRMRKKISPLMKKLSHV